jgi:hypothetical protein
MRDAIRPNNTAFLVVISTRENMSKNFQRSMVASGIVNVTSMHWKNIRNGSQRENNARAFASKTEDPTAANMRLAKMNVTKLAAIESR